MRFSSGAARFPYYQVWRCLCAMSGPSVSVSAFREHQIHCAFRYSHCVKYCRFMFGECSDHVRKSSEKRPFSRTLLYYLLPLPYYNFQTGPCRKPSCWKRCAKSCRCAGRTRKSCSGWSEGRETSREILLESPVAMCSCPLFFYGFSSPLNSSTVILRP